MITYNEEANIQRCLESLDWADEIVVVDSFSEDDTLKIARRFTERVLQNKWPGYVEQKNFALNMASHDWVFGIDADEVVSGELRTSILSVLSDGGGGFDGYFVPRRTFYLGRWIDHCGWYPDYKLRLFRKSKGRWVGAGLHERVGLSGRTSYLQGDLCHYPYGSVSEHLRKLDRYTSIWAQEMSDRGRKFHWIDLLVRPPFRFLRMFLLKLGFLNGAAGFVVSALGAIYVFAKYAKLWETKSRD